MALGPTGALRGPIRQPPLVSLLSSVDVQGPEETDEGQRWTGASELLPEPCPVGGVWDPCGVDDEKIASSQPGEVPNQPFGIWAGITCSTFSRSEVNELPAKAVRMLAAIESALIASELWEGTKSTAEGWSNQFLRDAPLVLGGDVDPADALACLEQAIAEGLDGSPGVIHTTRQVATLWKSLQLIERVGGKVHTEFGTLVVPDAGYTGSSPNGVTDVSGVSWAYATGPVLVRMGPEMMVPDTSRSGWITQATHRHPGDPQQNSVEVFAEKLVSTYFDDCVHAAVGVSVTPCEGLTHGS